MSTPASAAPTVLLDAEQIGRTLRRMAHEIVEREGESLDRLALVGIYTRGVTLARRLATLLAEIGGVEVPVGALDITFYRDDMGLRGGETRAHPQPVVKASSLDFPLDGATVVIVDDVLYTGRTVRAAIEAVFDYGRPARVRLAVLCDRGHRELPIRADVVGKNLPTSRAERVRVHLGEDDAADEVVLETGAPHDRRRCSSRPPCAPPGTRHLLSSEDLDRRHDRAPARARRQLRGGRRARGQEAADAARPHGAERLLRGLDAHRRRRSSSPPSGSRPTRSRSRPAARRWRRARRSRTRC